MKERVFMNRYEILELLDEDLAKELYTYQDFEDAEELRFRNNSPVIMFSKGKEYILKTKTDSKMIKNLILSLTSHSLTTFANEIVNGYFTMDNGVRVGLAGKVICYKNKIRNMRDFTSVNIRFPLQIIGLNNKIREYISCNGKICSLLIVSPPQCGKTTLLRDIIHAVSQGDGYEPQKVSVIDERAEVYAFGKFDLGIRTDVISLSPKPEGMRLALRSLSPDIIAVDEIGNNNELSALYEIRNSGVKVMATVHSKNICELKKRTYFKKILSSGIFDRIIFLSDLLGRGTVEEVYDSNGNVLLSNPILL